MANEVMLNVAGITTVGVAGIALGGGGVVGGVACVLTEGRPIKIVAAVTEELARRKERRDICGVSDILFLAMVSHNPDLICYLSQKNHQ